ncbi:MAG: IS21 family transposase [Desulfobacterales bacterium]|nr:MAG: IS21 family transposase [Desulfobacterales bacterium]
MPAERLTMRKIREVFRLKFDCDISNRQIAKSCNIARSTVAEYLFRFQQAAVSWPLANDIDDNQLEQLLYPKLPAVPADQRVVPDWSYIHQQLRHKSVTLMLLWQEYKEQFPQGYQYSQFCHLYRQWTHQIDPVMRQEHRAGEKLFVDYAGQTVPVYDLHANQMREAQIFVAVLGASNYTYAEATWSQALPDWIASHRRAFAFFTGVPQIVVPDNLKSGVNKACFYEPDINPTYLDMANYYDTVVIPTRVRKAKDKAKVEVAVQVVERWILARIRNRQFFSLRQLNETIAELLIKLNTTAFQKLPGCRKQMFEALDKPALKPLAVQPYAYAEWKIAAVNIDYHIEVDFHYYSVPYQLIGKKIDVRITENTIECFYKSKPVASHIRSYLKGRHTTLTEHMPKSHQQWAKWSPQRFINWAAKIGPHTAQLIEVILNSRKHPQQGFRSCMGILRLAKSYDDQRLEAACRRALIIGGTSYKSVASILKYNLDQKPLPGSTSAEVVINHKNIRGAHYYQ